MMIGTTTVDERYLKQLEEKALALRDYLEAVQRLRTKHLKHVLAVREGRLDRQYGEGYTDAVYDLGNLIDQVLTERMDGRR